MPTTASHYQQSLKPAAAAALFTRGIAFITFKTQEGADAALACNGEQVDGQTLKVGTCAAARGGRVVGSGLGGGDAADAASA
jgi:nucleolin